MCRAIALILTGLALSACAKTLPPAVPEEPTVFAAPVVVTPPPTPAPLPPAPPLVPVGASARTSRRASLM